MKNVILFLFIYLQLSNIFAQQSLCSDAVPLCTDSTYNHPLSTGTTAETGPDYDCLLQQPNPSWYYLQVSQAGDIFIHMESIPSSNDIDFICWGPFSTTTCTGLAANSVVDCSYSTSSIEDCFIPNAQVGDVYMFMLTNYSNQQTDVLFSYTSSTGASYCDILMSCNILNMTTTLSCDSTTGTYDINGIIEFVNPPGTGSLIIEDNAGYSQTINPSPNFISPTNFNITGIPLDGLNHTLYAYFTDDTTCIYTLNYVAPDTCTSCTTPQGSIAVTTPACYDSPVTFTYVAGTTDTNATYSWDFGTGASPAAANTLGPHTVTYSAPGLSPNITLTVTDSTCIPDIININITIPSIFSTTIYPVACNTYTSPSGNYTWTSSGTYVDTMISSIGCDSVININLIVGYSSDTTISQTVCDHYVSPSGQYTWTSSGTYVDTVISSTGCDSIININLIVEYNSDTAISQTVCDSYTSPSGNYTWTNSGIYIDTIPNSIGCDSIITISLTINSIDTSISQNGDTLFANAANATYQWLDCDNSYFPINGETSQLFVPMINGNYAVIVNDNNCTDTSSCYYVDVVGAIGNNNFDIVIYPNPTTGKIIIYAANNIENIEVFNLAGELITTKKYGNKYSLRKRVLYLTEQAKGIYIIKVTTVKKVNVAKIILE